MLPMHAELHETESIKIALLIINLTRTFDFIINVYNSENSASINPNHLAKNEEPRLPNIGLDRLHCKSRDTSFRDPAFKLSTDGL
jgi:hypothetical protein